MSSLHLSEQYIVRNKYTSTDYQLVSNGGDVFMNYTTNSSNGLWYLKSTPYDFYYRLHTVANGDTSSLDVINDNGTSSTDVHFAETGDYTGQWWRLDEWGDGTYRLSNNFTGQSVYLDMDVRSGVPHLRFGDGIAQRWEFVNAKDEDTSAVTSSSQAAGTQTLSTTPSSTIFSSANTPSHEKAISLGAIVGIAIGGLAALTLCVCAIICVLRRKRTKSIPVLEERLHAPPAERVDGLPDYFAATSKKEHSSTRVVPQGAQGQSTQGCRHTHPAEVAGDTVQNPTEMP